VLVGSASRIRWSSLSSNAARRSACAAPWGATRGQIRLQFLTESLLLSMLGGVGGVLLGIAVTTTYASTQRWPTVVPPWASAGGLAATLAIGAVAGLYPAIRAARLAPTEALAAP
jgi:putative ABC transport system permease protein